MNSRKRTKSFLFSVVCGFFVSSSATASEPIGPTLVEHESRWWPAGQSGSLGTIRYRPSKHEQPFFSRLPADEVATGSHVDDYDLSDKDQKYVGWFGIVRGIDEQVDADRTVLIVEHKYFDGFTDAHLLAVSFNGSGDFQATLTGTAHRIPPLSLVKVYGTVLKGEEGGLPRIDADFVRNWHWGTFTFLAAYGNQRGSEESRKGNQIPLDEIYDPWPHPCHHYYEERLGKRPDAPEIRKRLLDAAGPVSPEARPAMERLANLLALGHTWSRAETVRQSEELSQIRKLIKSTGSNQAAMDLLIQALHENDERVSWSASEKIAAFDPAGDAIGILANLLDHESLRVRAGAARALSFRYGVNAAPAVAALSRGVAETDPELKRYAILALGKIGPAAKASVPALKNALLDEDPQTRVDAAQALWRVDQQQPEDLIAVLVAILESGNVEQRGAAAEQLKEMGPWAAPAVHALIGAMKDREWVIRCTVADALGAIGPAAAAAIPALTEALEKDDDTSVQSRAAQALGKIHDPTAIPALIAALDNEDPSIRFSTVRFSAVGALESFGQSANAAIPALVRAVQNDTMNGWVAASALGTIDVEGVSTPVLVEALGKQDSQLRRSAALGLGRIGRKAGAAEEALHDGLGDNNKGARIAAAAAYWSVSGKADESVRVLRAAIQAPDIWLDRMWAADALAAIGPAAKEAVPELIECLKSDIRHVVISSAKALGRIGPDSASAGPALTAQLEHTEDHYTRACLARALWRINRSAASLSVLQDTLTNSGDSIAVSEAADAIGDMGPLAKGSAPLLRPLLKNSDSFVREAAANALEQFEGK